MSGETTLNIESNIREQVARFGQEHLLAFWNELDRDQQSSLASQLEQIDFELIASFVGGCSQDADWRSIAGSAVA
ncbi:hypothetical protein ACFL2H_13435, partial [Planctomycetota bacterium]